jgi:hypothetical protein
MMWLWAWDLNLKDAARREWKGFALSWPEMANAKMVVRFFFFWCRGVFLRWECGLGKKSGLLGACTVFGVRSLCVIGG